MIPKWIYVLMVEERRRTSSRVTFKRKDLEEESKVELDLKLDSTELAVPGYKDYNILPKSSRHQTRDY